MMPQRARTRRCAGDAGVLSTYTSYSLIAKDLAKSLARTADELDVARATEYYKANIGSVKSVDDLMKNDRLYRYVLKAYGLEDMAYGKALIRKVLEGGIDDKSALANKLTDPRFKALATAFNFPTFGATTTITKAVEQDTVDAYVRQSLEQDAGEQNEGVRLALYFQRKASGITSAYGILADKALLQVVQTALGLSELTSLQDIDQQAKTINTLMDIEDLKDPAEVQKFIEKFTAKYDAGNAQTGASNPILMLFQPAGGVTISNDIYASLQNLKLGGT
jgi:hypothetical protein